MSDYRVNIKVRNNRILKKIEERGYASPLEFCRKNKMAYPTLLDYVNLKKKIFNKNNKLQPSVRNLCEILKCMPEELFSETQQYMEIESNQKAVECSEQAMQGYLENYKDPLTLEEQIDEKLLLKQLDKTLSSITPRERKILEARFGLAGEEARSLREIADEYDVSASRIRQIEQTALRKLRHPTRAIVLGEFIGREKEEY